MDKTQLPSDDKIFIALTQANHSMIHMAIKASGLGSGTKKIALFSLGNTH